MFLLTATGNLTKDAEARQFEERFAISMSIAVNKKYKDQERATFLNLTYWSKSDKILQYLKKGKKIGIVADWYENAKGKDDKYYQNFSVREIEFLSPIESDANSAGNTANSADNSKDTYNTMEMEKNEKTSSNQEKPFNPFDDDEDDLPF